MSLKFKISTPFFEQSVEFYRQVLGMHLVEEWDSPGDKGAIMGLSGGHDEALLEIWYSEEKQDFSGLSLQFRIENLADFVNALPESVDYDGPRPRPWGSTYLYLRDPSDILVVVYEGGI